MQVIHEQAAASGRVIVSSPKGSEQGSIGARLEGKRTVPNWWHAAKRAIDIALGSLLLLVALPVIAAAALAIVLVDRGSPFFAQERVGHDLVVFSRNFLRGSPITEIIE